jgi:nicotinamide-nucleotide amidase
MQSKDVINLTQALGEKFLMQNIILTTVESCTGGLLAAQLTNIPGSSTWFDRGFITYSNQSKVDCVRVKKVLSINMVRLANKLLTKWP